MIWMATGGLLRQHEPSVIAKLLKYESRKENNHLKLVAVNGHAASECACVRDLHGHPLTLWQITAPDISQCKRVHLEVLRLLRPTVLSARQTHQNISAAATAPAVAGQE